MNFITKPKNGFLLGKFYPPHKGHQYLVDFAANYCEHLTVLVCALPTECIAGSDRLNWMTTMFPNCTVKLCNEILPQVPEEDPENFWKIWNNVIVRYTDERPDVVFASESYGKRLADDLDARFVPIDLNRETVDISATRIRNNPEKYWDYIPDVVKPFFVKRICMFGPESSGKTTLGKRLARELETTFLPEYGRVYTEFFGPNVTDQDLKYIVQGHMASVSAAKKQSRFYLIEDTDPVMSAVWQDMLLESRHEWFSTFTDYADLYVLCDIDIPWKDDGTRYFKDEYTRRLFYDRCEKELIDRSVKYVKVTGTVEERVKTVLQYIKNTQ